MLCYKQINLDCADRLKKYLYNWVIQSFPNLPVRSVISKFVILPDELLTTVNTELNFYGIPNIDYCRIYLWPKSSIQQPHVDGTDVILHCSINIPLHGGENSNFQWLGGDYELKLGNIGLTQKAHMIQWNSLPTVIDSVELAEGCYLIRIDQPHQAIASEESDRWVFTMRFKGNPTFEDLYDRLPASNI